MNELEKFIFEWKVEHSDEYCVKDCHKEVGVFITCDECESRYLAKALTDNGYVKPVDVTGYILFKSCIKSMNNWCASVEVDGKRYRQVWIEENNND